MMECSYFGECGSCRLYEKGYEGQLQEKKARVSELFQDNFSGEMRVFRSPDQHYRARSEFKLWHKEDEIYYAMNALEHKGVVLVENCPQVIEPIAALMPRLITEIKEKQIDFKLFGVDFLSSSAGEIVVSLLYHRRLDDAWQEKAAQIAEKLSVSIIGRSRKQKRVIGKDFITETLNFGGRNYLFEHIENSFTQPNPRVNEKMVSWALEAFGNSRGDLLELYCGAGNFTIPFASKFDKVLATEISKASIRAAKRNMELNDVHNIDFVRMSAEEFVQALDGVREFRRMKDIDIKEYELSTIFVDPPRAGMDEATCDFATRFDQVLYISCNPETLKRDVERMKETHEIVSMALFDQFPYTHHLEMGVMLKKRT